MHAKHGERQISIKPNAPAAMQPERSGARSTVAMTGGAGLVALVLLFLASLAYVVFGGAFAESSTIEAETQIAAVAAKPADAGGATQQEAASSAYAEVPAYSPPAAGSPGRDGDGNVMTYEHD
jgi:hypothetical protein